MSIYHCYLYIPLLCTHYMARCTTRYLLPVHFAHDHLNTRFLVCTTPYCATAAVAAIAQGQLATGTSSLLLPLVTVVFVCNTLLQC
jgi:hypothetical protein